MRIFVPATSADLAVLVEAGQFGSPPITAFAVTPGLREWYVDDDPDELEYAAMLEAARASLRMIDSDPTVARRRVVVAVEVAAAEVAVRDDLDRGVVRVSAVVAMADIAAVHVDDADAEAAVALAAQAIIASDLGEADAQAAVDDAEGYELSWYANQEIAGLLETL